MHVAITGASGLIGRSLSAALSAEGHTVSHLVRKANVAPTSETAGAPESPSAPPHTSTQPESSARPPHAVGHRIAWLPLEGILDPRSLEDVDAVVHLAGESVAERWTDKRKAEIRESRVLGTRTLVEALALATPRPRVLISASAVGYYGAVRGDEQLDESSPAGDDFLADVCRAWEAEAMRAQAHGLRVVCARLGIVLAAQGGALAKMSRAYRAGGGGKLGDGRQYMSWIALPDVVRALLHILTRPVSGAANLVADATPQADFARTLAKVLSRPSFMRVPAFAVKALFGEMGAAMLLGGQRVVPKALVESGFDFRHSDLEAALRVLLGHS